MSQAPIFLNKVVWITGASSGIGEQLAYQLAELGAKLVLSSRRKTALERVSAACKKGTEVLVVPLDLGTPDTFAEKVAEVQDSFGQIDFLINNAGIGQNGFVDENEMQVYQQVLQVNLLGPIALTKAVLPVMLKQGSGHITGVSSILGKLIVRERSAYCASKYAFNAFLDTLRLELQKKNIQVLTACPGATQTNMEASAINGTGHATGQVPDEYNTWMLPEKVAAEILKGIRRKKREILIGSRFEKFGVFMIRFLPAIYHRFGP